MNKVNYRQIEAVVKKIVAESLEQLDADSTDKRAEEMESDWAELERINKKYANSITRENPRFAKDFNKNVEDGRENAEAYANGLFESIKKSVTKKVMGKFVKK